MHLHEINICTQWIKCQIRPTFKVFSFWIWGQLAADWQWCAICDHLGHWLKVKVISFNLHMFRLWCTAILPRTIATSSKLYRKWQSKILNLWPCCDLERRSRSFKIKISNLNFYLARIPTLTQVPANLTYKQAYRFPFLNNGDKKRNIRMMPATVWAAASSHPASQPHNSIASS